MSLFRHSIQEGFFWYGVVAFAVSLIYVARVVIDGARDEWRRR